MSERTGRKSSGAKTSRSSSSNVRRPSLPRLRSSPRLVRTISAESETLTRAVSHLSLDGGAQDSIWVPFVKGVLNASLPHEYLRADVLNLAQALKLPKWHNKKGSTTHLIPNLVKLTKITGALTNAIFKVEYPSLPSLLLRVYGPQVESIIDRDYELKVLARLSSHNVGPKLYGCFTNGRFEQFLENSTTLTRHDIRDWHTSQRIARRMKELHTGVPLLPFEIKQGPISWFRMDKWLKVFEQSKWSRNDSNIQEVLLADSFTRFLEMVQRYRNWLDEAYHGSKDDLAFCHNDAQYGNLLFTSPVAPPVTAPTSSAASIESSNSLFPTSSNISVDQIINPPQQEQAQDSKLVVIDFEYSGANRPAFDLANHFSEWMCDYNCSEAYKSDETKYPTKAELLNFLYSYASHRRSSHNGTIDKEVRELYNDVIRQRACVSLHWCMWAIIQSGELDDAKKDKVIEEGPGGEKYVITVDPDDEGAVEDSDSSVDGVDIDTFDNIRFATEKIAIFWGDLLQLGLVKKEELPNGIKLKLLDTAFL